MANLNKKKIADRPRTLNFGVFPDFKSCLPELKKFSRAADKICVVCDTFCRKKFSRQINLIKKTFPGKVEIYVPFSGKIKTLSNYSKFIDFLIKKKFGRDSLIIAFGGGTICDFAGFAAATFMRGIKWLAVPTTFLAQIDAGIGGKTALDFGGIKNVVGAFYQPLASLLCVSFAAADGGRNIKSALGELIKYVFIAREKYPPKTELFLKRVLSADKKAIIKAVEISASLKADIAAKDEKDENGVREILNFGHTFGHAFESLGKGALSHGEAVLLGMKFAAFLSFSISRPDEKFKIFAENILKTAGFKKMPKSFFNFEKFYSLIQSDKKRGKSENKFLIFSPSGSVKPIVNLDKKTIKKTFKEFIYAHSDNSRTESQFSRKKKPRPLRKRNFKRN